MKKLYIVGAGGCGREVYHWAKAHSDCDRLWEIAGFLDDNPKALDGFNYPVKIVGSIEGFAVDANVLLVCAIANPIIKERICCNLLSRGFEFISLIHPTATIGGNVELGQGCVICPRVILTCDIKIGDFVFFNCASIAGHDVSVGDYSTISGSVELTGGVVLGKRVFVGSHATTHPGATVGDDAKLGLGSVVIGRIGAAKSVFGIPAKSL